MLLVASVDGTLNHNHHEVLQYVPVIQKSTTSSFLNGMIRTRLFLQCAHLSEDYEILTTLLLL